MNTIENPDDIFEANGAKFYAEHDMIVRWIRQTGHKFEPVTTKWLFDRLSEKDGIYLDVGVSTGWFAMPVALSGRKVIGVEANARVQDRLLANAELNDVEVDLIKAGASDKNGEMTFGYNPRLPLTSGGSLVDGVAGNEAKETVKTVTLDSVCDDDVSVLKIDVEGHEIPVLEGAKEIIARSRPFLILEANTTRHFQQLAEWLGKNNYTSISADKRNMLCSPLQQS